jgi:hypothetical protein
MQDGAGDLPAYNSVTQAAGEVVHQKGDRCLGNLVVYFRCWTLSSAVDYLGVPGSARFLESTRSEAVWMTIVDKPKYSLRGLLFLKDESHISLIAPIPHRVTFDSMWLSTGFGLRGRPITPLPWPGLPTWAPGGPNWPTNIIAWSEPQHSGPDLASNSC